MNYLTKESIIRLNKQAINLFGGSFVQPFNLIHEDRLNYLVDIVKHDDYYPSLDQKAALYIFKLCGGQMFNDGNKRTGLAAMLAFLYINKFELQSSLAFAIFNGKTIPTSMTHSTSNKILENFTMEIANNQLELEEIADFINKNKIPL